jgi:hypothetical protein
LVALEFDNPGRVARVRYQSVCPEFLTPGGLADADSSGFEYDQPGGNPAFTCEPD